MTNPVHLLSVAALLLVAFLVGAVVGTLARLLVLRLTRRPASAVAALVEAASTATPLVATPVISPLPITPTPVAPPPAQVPVPDFAATMIALANEAPPPAFVEVTRSRGQQQDAEQAPTGLRVMPSIAPLPAVEPAAPAAPMQPAKVAGETTSGIHIAAPLHENPPESAAAPAKSVEQHTAEVIPFPTASLEPPTESPTDVVVGGEAVAVVDTSDLVFEAHVVEAVPDTEQVVVEATVASSVASSIVAEDDFLVVGEEAFAVPQAEIVPATASEPTADTIPVPIIAAGAAIASLVTADLPVPEIVAAPVAPDVSATIAVPSKPTLEVPVTEAAAPARLIAEPELPAAPKLGPVAAPPGEPVAEAPAPVAEAAPPAKPEPIVVSLDQAVDEDAAMRAIEGNWTPRRPPARVPRPVAAPEGVNQAVAASARAVNAARRTAEAVIAEVAEVKAEAKAADGRPDGLEAPRDGRKDDLTHIIGVLPVIETALNKLGVYHFDQVGGLSDANIGWIEGHLGVPGRIGRELWREQARELSAVLKPKRTAEKK